MAGVYFLFCFYIGIKIKNFFFRLNSLNVCKQNVFLKSRYYF